MGDAVRVLWLFMTVLCCVWSFISCLVGDPSGALALGGAGVVFWLMSDRHFDDFDAL
jgi:hypothetical protein